MRDPFTGRKTRRRLEDWETRLMVWLTSVRDEKLSYGRFDCVIGLSCGAVERQTGENLIHLAPDYKNRREALKIVKDAGGYESLMDGYLKRAPRFDRHRGNIVLLHSDYGPAFGVRVSSQAAFLTENGLRMSTITQGSPEWSVVG